MPKSASINRVIDKVRFQTLWRDCLLPNAIDDSTAIYQQLVASYSEPQRVYHTLNHIEACLEVFDEAVSTLDDPNAVELSIWFHDVIFELCAKNNEQRSADHFMEITDGIFDNALRNKVYHYIMATLHCGSEITDADSKVVVDIDLFSFALPWPDFLRDSDNVHREACHMSDEEFYQRQTGFQQTLLDRPRFFQSDYFYKKYENQARRNLADYFELVRQKLANK